MAERGDRIPATPLVSVEFPGYVKNIEKVIDCLGGMEKISQACYAAYLSDLEANNKLGPKLPANLNAIDRNPAIELRFRPNDPLAHPASGINSSVKRVLLKLTVDDDDGTIENTEVVGSIGSSFMFDGMADFQVNPARPARRYTVSTILNSLDCSRFLAGIQRSTRGWTNRFVNHAVQNISLIYLS